MKAWVKVQPLHSSAAALQVHSLSSSLPHTAAQADCILEASFRLDSGVRRGSIASCDDRCQLGMASMGTQHPAILSAAARMFRLSSVGAHGVGPNPVGHTRTPDSG